MSSYAHIQELLREVIEQDVRASNEAVAITALTTLKVNIAASMLLKPMVANEVARIRREEVRAVEKAVLAPSPRRATGAPPRDRHAERTQFADETFPLGDGSAVRWVDATIEQHHQRIKYLLRQVAGTHATVSRHEEAIRRIAAVDGAKCLGDLS